MVEAMTKSYLTVPYVLKKKSTITIIRTKSTISTIGTTGTTGTISTIGTIWYDLRVAGGFILMFALSNLLIINNIYIYNTYIISVIVLFLYSTLVRFFTRKMSRNQVQKVQTWYFSLLFSVSEHADRCLRFLKKSYKDYYVKYGMILNKTSYDLR